MPEGAVADDGVCDAHVRVEAGEDAVVIEQPQKNPDGSMTQGDFLDRTAFRIVKNGFYIPIYDRKTGDLIFTPEDYEQLRTKLSGNHEYRTGEYQFASAEDFAADAERTAGIEINVSDNAAEVARKNAAIQAAFERTLEGTGLQFRGHIDGDLVPGFIEITSTGSTGRGTNVPGDGDFDYILRVDKNLLENSSQMAEVASRIQSAIIFDEKSKKRGGKGPHDIRTKHVHVDGLPEEVEIDISYVTRTDKITYATEDAIKDYLSNFDEEQRAQVIRNIIYAKQLFKRPEYHCYKPKHAGGNDEETGASLAEGGLGGVGVENWILQNGGSLTAAARSFLEAAGITKDNPNAEPVPLETFQQRYPIWDLGANHMSGDGGKYPHDNFTQNNLDAGGYSRMIEALKAYLGY